MTRTLSSVKNKADEFVTLNGGSIIGNINGRDGTIAYKILNDNRMFHVYYSRRWYYNPDGISIPEHALNEGLRENASIVVYIIDECVWQYATKWIGKKLHNSLSGTTEVLLLKENLLTGTFTQEQGGMDTFL